MTQAKCLPCALSACARRRRAVPIPGTRLAARASAPRGRLAAKRSREQAGGARAQVPLRHARRPSDLEPARAETA